MVGSPPPHYGGPIVVRSHVQKLVTLSSCEAELNAVHQYQHQFHYLRSLMTDFGFDQSLPVQAHACPSWHAQADDFIQRWVYCSPNLTQIRMNDSTVLYLNPLLRIRSGITTILHANIYSHNISLTYLLHYIYLSIYTSYAPLHHSGVCLKYIEFTQLTILYFAGNSTTKFWYLICQ
jgi:hypothetical protein